MKPSRWSSQTLASQDERGFLGRRLGSDADQDAAGMFLVCAAHLNNHVGQMSYLVQALQAGTGEKPVW